MAQLCSNPPCDQEAVINVSVLGPTGEVITDDTGSAPVLREVLSGAMCVGCGSGFPNDAWIAALGAHVDVSDIDNVPEQADGITAAKAAAVLNLAGHEVIDTPNGPALTTAGVLTLAARARS